MNIECLFKSLSDFQRIRMLSLLLEGPLCVCHVMDILDSEQVKVSKQLRYMKSMQVVEAEREAQWMIYRIAPWVEPFLQVSVMPLRTWKATASLLQEDLRKRDAIVKRIQESGAHCPEVVLGSCGHKSLELAEINM